MECCARLPYKNDKSFTSNGDILAMREMDESLLLKHKYLLIAIANSSIYSSSQGYQFYSITTEDQRFWSECITMAAN
jgi:hypothetical protein